MKNEWVIQRKDGVYFYCNTDNGKYATKEQAEEVIAIMSNPTNFKAVRIPLK